MKQTSQRSRKRSSGPWLVAIGSVFALAAVLALFTTGNERPRDGHAPVVKASGRSDASHVLDPARFADDRQRQAYTVAHQIPAVLNQLYCWCGCKEHSGHRALLECFETDHASNCDICMGEAMTAKFLASQGVTDIRKIQDQIDVSFGPRTAGS